MVRNPPCELNNICVSTLVESRVKIWPVKIMKPSDDISCCPSFGGGSVVDCYLHYVRVVLAHVILCSYLMFLLDLQSSHCGRENCFLCFNCILAVVWMSFLFPRSALGWFVI